MHVVSSHVNRISKPCGTVVYHTQTKAAKAINRLAFHLPKELLGMVARALLVGKIGYDAAAP